MTAGLAVGAARADITPAVGCAMGGYGARKGRAEAIAAPLHCRAFVFDQDGTVLALVVCDLLFATHDITSLARQLVLEMTGIPAESVLVTGTHTHSGPAGLTQGLGPLFAGSVSHKIAGSVAEAYRCRRAARLKYAEVDVSSISQNRRDPDGPTETTARLLIAEAEDSAAALATIVNYACHATVLEHDNLAISPDFPGAVVASVERNVGGQAAYLQGCAGSINPVWMRHDHAEAGRIGSILGLAAARAVQEAVPVGRGQWSVNLSRAEDLPKPTSPACRSVADGPLSGASVRVSLSRRARPPADALEAELSEIEAALRQPGDQGRRRELLARRAAARMELYFAGRPYPYAVRAGAGSSGPDEVDQVEVQALRLGGDTVVVGVPGEPFLEIGEHIRRLSPVPQVVVAGYANEAIGYVPMPADFGSEGYEVGCARFTPAAAQSLVEGALAAIAKTGAGTG